jgi:hypothetical protein
MKIISLKVPGKSFNLKDKIYESLAFSLINFIVFSWLLAIENNDYRIFTIIIISLVGPVLLSFLYIKIVNSNFFKENFDIQTPTAWDEYFSRREEFFIIVHLKSGEKVCGYFGSNSYASSFPNNGELYIEKLFKYENNKIGDIIEYSKGVIIQKDSYELIEFIDIGD